MNKSGSKSYVIFMITGACIGTVIGLMLKDVGLWASIGLGAGVVVDTLINMNKNRENK